MNQIDGKLVEVEGRNADKELGLMGMGAEGEEGHTMI